MTPERADRPKRVLVVDDEEAFCSLLGDILREVGYSVDVAGGGGAAIEWFKRERADLVLLDIMMPQVSGWHVVEFLGTLPEPPPVLLVSALHEMVPPGPVASYVVGCVVKPFSIESLTRSCATAMARAAVVERDQRREPRRTFVADATVQAEGGTPLATGRLVEVSRHGFRIEVAIPLALGDGLRISLRVPGREGPLVLPGRVRWRDGQTVGLQIEGLDPADNAALKELLAGPPPGS